jgi:hypothetical protein
VKRRIRDGHQGTKKTERENFLQEVTEATEKEWIAGILLSPLPLLPPVQILVFAFSGCLGVPVAAASDMLPE